MKTILVDYNHNIIRTAYVEEGRLKEVIIDKKDNESIVGNIYVGIVKNILSCQFAFVDIGQEKNAFLCLSDAKEKLLYKDKKLQLKVGQSLMVEVVKDPTGDKGAAITTQVSLAGDSVIIFLTEKTDKPEIGISKKIEDVQTRRRLKKLGQDLLSEGLGMIMRTSSADKSQEDLAYDMETTANKFKKICGYSSYIKAPSLLYGQNNWVSKGLQTLLTHDIDNIIINNESILADMKNTLEPKSINIPIEVYAGEVPLFREHFVESQMEKALHKKVWLSSGGFIIIEETEAAVIIDVNTGKFSDGKNHQKTIVKTNKEAAVEIAHQIRLRNLSGIIMIDFIDLKKDTDRDRLMDILRTETKKDRLGVSIEGMAYSGIMILTRKKTRESLLKTLTLKCGCCHGVGRIIQKN